MPLDYGPPVRSVRHSVVERAIRAEIPASGGVFDQRDPPQPSRAFGHLPGAYPIDEDLAHHLRRQKLRAVPRADGWRQRSAVGRSFRVAAGVVAQDGACGEARGRSTDGQRAAGE